MVPSEPAFVQALCEADPRAKLGLTPPLDFGPIFPTPLLRLPKKRQCSTGTFGVGRRGEEPWQARSPSLALAGLARARKPTARCAPL